MRTIDAIRYRNILRDIQTNSTYYDEKKCRELLGELIDTLDEQPTVPPAEKVLTEFKIEREKLEDICKELIAEYEAMKEHEHDYFIASISSESYISSEDGRFRKATLVCRKCGETKEIRVVKNAL